MRTLDVMTMDTEPLVPASLDVSNYIDQPSSLRAAGPSRDAQVTAQPKKKAPKRKNTEADGDSKTTNGTKPAKKSTLIDDSDDDVAVVSSSTKKVVVKDSARLGTGRTTDKEKKERKAKATTRKLMQLSDSDDDVPVVISSTKKVVVQDSTQSDIRSDVQVTMKEKEKAELSRKKVKSIAVTGDAEGAVVLDEQSSKKESHSKKRKSNDKDYQCAKKSKTEMECPECEFHTQSVDVFVKHLRERHDTTLTLAGFALLCECGQEAHSNSHGRDCQIANFTVIRKREGPIRRIKDQKKTPKCVMDKCKAHPKTAKSYVGHLRNKHGKTLKDCRIYLICTCGYKVEYRCGMGKKSKHQCESQGFTLHTFGPSDDSEAR